MTRTYFNIEAQCPSFIVDFLGSICVHLILSRQARELSCGFREIKNGFYQHRVYLTSVGETTHHPSVDAVSKNYTSAARIHIIRC